MGDVIPLLKFTPSAQDPEVLEAITVQREPLIAALVDSALDEAGGARHHLLVGPRGIGKTHTLSIVASRIRADERAGSVVVAWLDEDPWAVRTYGKFLAAIAARVATETDDPALQEEAAALRSSGAGTSESEGEALLRRAVGDCRLVMLVENLDQIFRRIGGDGQARFRAFAEDWPHLLILATTPQLFAGVRLHASPFYGFFAVTHLDELNLDNAIELLKRIARLRDDPALLRFLGTDTAVRRLQAVQALAGGHPRVWLLLAGCISIAAIDELVPLFLEALDDLTPYYQDRLRTLGDQQQEIVVLLSEAGGALSNRALAERSGVAQNQVATILRQLADHGYVRRAELPDDLAGGDRRMSFWELREPLMRLCLDVKQARGEPLRIVVEFLRAWYGPRLLDELVRLPPSAHLAATYASEAFRALDGSIESDDLLYGSSNDIIARAERGLLLLPGHAGLQSAKTTGLIMQGRFKEVRDLLQQMLVAESPGVEHLALRLQLAVTQDALGESVDSDAILAEALEVGNARPTDSTAAAFVAFALARSERYEDAVGAWDRVIELDSMNAEFHNQRGLALAGLGRTEAALAAFTEAIELSPGTDDYHAARGHALVRLDRDHDALADFTQAVELNPDNPENHGSCVGVLIRLDRFDEALVAATRAVELHPGSPRLHRARGLALVCLNLHDEALAAATQATTLDPENDDYHDTRGLILGVLGRDEEALQAFARAIALDPVNAEFHKHRGMALGDLNRDEDALVAFDEAAALDPGNAEIHDHRGFALERLDRQSEALEAYTQAAQIDPTRSDSHNARANILRLLGQSADAEQAARRAIELDRQDSIYRFTLAEISLTSGDFAEALAQLREALMVWSRDKATSPGDSDLLCRILWERLQGDGRQREVIPQIVSAYDEVGSCDALGRGVVSSIPLFVDERVAQGVADAWVEAWSQAPSVPDLAVPLSLLEAARAWKHDRDAAHLVALPSEQRKILVELLMP